MKQLIFYCSVLIFLFSSANVCRDSNHGREKINFDRGWKFHFGHAADPSKDFNYTIANIFSKTGKGDNSAVDPKFNDSTWSNIRLPHDWAVTLPFEFSPNFDVMAHGYKPIGGLFPQNSVGWYRKTFFIERGDTAKRLALQFDGIFRDSRIWLNGHLVGSNPSGYMGITCDVTDFINYGGSNVLVVRADASQSEGWFYEGAGIYRHVWLLKYGTVHFATDGLFVHADISKKNAFIRIETSIENSDLLPANSKLGVFLADRAGKPVSNTTERLVTLGPNGKQQTDVIFELNDPTYWDLNNPYLYRAVCSLKIDNTLTDSVSIRFGVRTIAFDSISGFLLNGKSVKIQGVNCHQDHAGVGSALPDYLQYYRIQLLKEMGVNAYRTSHNAPTPELLDACDSLGMLVLDENRLLNSSPQYLNDWERQLKRDRNHASVFMWSIGNEEGYVQTTPVGKRIAQTLLAKQREIDPTRTSTYAADVPNVFNGINEVIPVRGFNYRILGVDPYHKDHPGQPIVGTEMGSTVTTRGIYAKDTINCYLPDQDITFPWWANTAEDWWSLAADRPWWMGGFVWTGFDYRGEPTPFEWPNINSHFGIMDMCGFPKNIYYYYQSWWLNEDVLHISPHWNWQGSEGTTIPVWVNSNADQVELFLNGKSLGKKEMQRNRHLQWDVVYTPGELEAIGYRNGKEIKAKVETTGEAVQLVLSTIKKSVSANGNDATILNVSSVDKLGREVPTANNLVHFSVNGDAQFIGVGNGDPSSHEPDQFSDGKYLRHLFSGKCQIILQAGSNVGTIQVKASAEGLHDAIIVIEQK